MIRYRYNMSVDPEPLRVNRVQVIRDYDEDEQHHHYLGDVWTRDNCKKQVGGFVYGPPNRLRIGRSHRSLPKQQWRRERNWPRALCRPDDHIHWYNGDHHRAWGNFRGHTGEVIDLDAFRRLRSMYRKRRR